MTDRQDQKASLQQKVVKALRRSGYPLELRVAAKLRESEHHYVQHTRHYVDSATGKIREIDVVACYRATRGIDNSFVYLVVECKNKPHPWVVFEPDESTLDLRELTTSLFAREFYERPRLMRIITDRRFRQDRTLLQPARIGRSIVEAKVGRDESGVAPDEDGCQTIAAQRDGRPDGAYSAVQAAVSAVQGFWHDVDEAALRKVAKTSAVVVPTVVTSGALFRGWLGDTGEIEVGPTDFTWVYVRPNAQAIPRRCAIVTEEGLPRLMRQARRTADVLLPPRDFEDSPADSADDNDELFVD